MLLNILIDVLDQYICPNDSLINLFPCVQGSLNKYQSIMNEKYMLPFINSCMGCELFLAVMDLFGVTRVHCQIKLVN